MRHRGIYRQRGIERRTGVILHVVDQVLEVRSPLGVENVAGWIIWIGSTAPVLAAIARGRDLRMVNLVEREVMIKESWIGGVIKFEPAITGVAVGTKPTGDRAAK